MLTTIKRNEYAIGSIQNASSSRKSTFIAVEFESSERDFSLLGNSWIRSWFTNEIWPLYVFFIKCIWHGTQIPGSLRSSIHEVIAFAKCKCANSWAQIVVYRDKSRHGCYGVIRALFAFFSRNAKLIENYASLAGINWKLPCRRGVSKLFNNVYFQRASFVYRGIPIESMRLCINI